jgi:hypothetical protein
MPVLWSKLELKFGDPTCPTIKLISPDIAVGLLLLLKPGVKAYRE